MTKASNVSATSPRQSALRNALPASLDMLYRRKAADIPEGYIEDYVALGWLEWHGGGLRVTDKGESVSQELRDPSPPRRRQALV